MRKTLLIALSALITAPLPIHGAIAAAHAAQDESREIGAWTLTDDGESCAIWKISESGQGITMFHDGATGVDGLGFVEPGLTGIKKDSTATLHMSVDGGDPVEIIADALIVDDMSGYVMEFPLQTLADLELFGIVDFKLDGKTIHSFKLDGLQPAMQALITCGKKYV